MAPLASMGAGDYFGEIGLIGGRPRTATATTPARLLRIEGDAFLDALSQLRRRRCCCWSQLCASDAATPPRLRDHTCHPIVQQTPVTQGRPLHHASLFEG